MTAVSAPNHGFWRRFTPLFALGLIGVAGLGPALTGQLDTLPPDLPLPPSALIAAALVQATALIAGGTAVGAALAPRLGLRSHIAERFVGGPPVAPALTAEAPLALGMGLVSAAVIVGLDFVLRPLLPPTFLATMPAIPYGMSALVSGLLYGGIAEELLMRWGLMSLVAWAGWRVVHRSGVRPAPAVMWLAIAIGAVLFGLGHLPAAAMLAPLTPAFVLRTVLLNSVAGLVTGWLFWRRSLEAAMIAHMAVHIGFALARLLAM